MEFNKYTVIASFLALTGAYIWTLNLRYWSAVGQIIMFLGVVIYYRVSQKKK